MSAKDLACLPESLQAIARVSSNGEASWPLAEATAVINALAQADRIVLGLDIREYDDDAAAADHLLDFFFGLGRGAFGCRHLTKDSSTNSK